MAMGTQAPVPAAPTCLNKLSGTSAFPALPSFAPDTKNVVTQPVLATWIEPMFEIDSSGWLAAVPTRVQTIGVVLASVVTYTAPRSAVVPTRSVASANGL